MTPQNIELTPVEGSSLIRADGWNEDDTVLIVKYHNGKTYRFSGLSAAVRKAYEAADSKGKYLRRSIEPLVKGVPV